MRKIIKDNYISTCKRGLINDKTQDKEFLLKIEEETKELIEYFLLNKEIDWMEVSDIILTCLNFCVHKNIDPYVILREKVNINFNRILNL